MTFENRYDHKEREIYWQAYWQEHGVYSFRDDQVREQTFVIDTPPPTVSGQLHMGHIYSYAHADFIARYKRMKGFDVFYPMGFDDNGLPTERLVEKQKKIRAKDVSRETFISLCEEVSAEARIEYRELFCATALSVDWALEYNTISEEVRRISQASFIDLYERGHVERKLQPMFWDVIDQTAIAQAEIEDKELEGLFVDIRFEVEGGGEFIIGTTRPEMLPACVAIFYHPDDARYAHLKGKFAITPLFGVRVPILTDDTVEIDKGTGIMMCCTFGDEADIEKWRKHGLETRVILNQYGKLSFSNFMFEDATGECSPLAGERQKQGEAAADAWGVLKNLTVKSARIKIIELLEEKQLITNKRNIIHSVKCAERSGAPIEILPSQQWFVKVLEHKEALKARSKSCNWNPEWMEKRMEQWIDGLKYDWCISRQRIYGVPFPVWYSNREGEQGKILLPDISQLPVNPMVDLPLGYNRDEVMADTDVMDTWATSSLTPQISAGSATKPNAKLFPADLRPQAHEIIRTWAFYSLVKAHLHNDDLPWRNLMISGWCLASDKTKMSKSKGNVITPLSLLQEKSADSVRHWASSAKLGSDTAFSEDLLKIGAKLINKLWNAGKFAATQLEAMQGKSASASATDAIGQNIIICEIDKFMIARTQATIEKYDECFADYDYAGARAAIEDLFWNDFCDNYLEIVKARSYGQQGEAAQQSSLHTIHHCFNAILKLFAPFIPHITEELFSKLYATEFAKCGSIHARGGYPLLENYNCGVAHDVAEQNWFATKAIIELVRKAKSQRGVSIKYPILQMSISGIEIELFTLIADDVKAVGNIEVLHYAQDLPKLAGGNATNQVDMVGEADIIINDGDLQIEVVFAAQAEVA